jgi:hypothetical protein
MAVQNSVEYAKELTNPPTLKDPCESGGKLQVLKGVITAATWNNGDIGYLFTAPSIAKIVGGYMETDGLGTSCTIKIGYTGVDDALVAATAMATATRVQVPKLAAIGLDAGGKLIFATLAGANATNGKILHVQLWYVAA